MKIQNEIKCYLTEITQGSKKFSGQKILATSWEEAAEKVKIHNNHSCVKLNLVGQFVDETV